VLSIKGVDTIGSNSWADEWSTILRASPIRVDDLFGVPVLPSPEYFLALQRSISNKLRRIFLAGTHDPS